MAGATVALVRAADGTEVATATSATDGRFSIEAADGAYYFVVDPAPGFGSFVRSRVNGVNVAGGNVVKNIALVSGKSLFGVVRMLDGRAVQGVRVSVVSELTNATLGSVTTDVDGGFAYSVPAGVYRFYVDGVWSNLEGRPYNFNLSNAARNTTVDAATQQDITLPVAFLRGRVVKSDGTPASGVELVTNWTGGSMSDGSTCNIVHTARASVSDADGRYAMGFCNGLSYDIAVTPTAGLGLATRVFRGVAIAGDTSREFVLEAGYEVSGLVSFPNGVAVPGISVQLIDEVDLRAVAVSLADTDGRYSFRAMPGRYQYYVGSGTERYAGRPYNFVFSAAYRNTVVEGNTSRDIVLPLSFLRGRVVDEGGAGLAGVELVTNWTAGPLADGSSCSIVHTAGAIVSSGDGSYAMAFCNGLTYSITARPPPNSSQLPNAFAGVTVVADELRDFVMRPANLRGFVRLPDGAPVPGVGIQVIDENNGTAYGPIVADAAGAYGFRLPAGRFKYYLSGANETYIGRPHNFVYSDALKGTIVSEAGATVQDVVLPFAFLDGRVSDSNGVPVPGAQISINWTGGSRPDGSACSVVHIGTAASGTDGTVRLAFCGGLAYNIAVAPTASSGFVSSSLVDFRMDSHREIDIILPWADTKPPVILSGPIVTEVKPTRATVVWQTDEPARGGVTWEGGSAAETEFRTRHSELITGLAPGTTYTVTVSATDRSGNGPTTASVTFTTRGGPDTTPPLIVSGPVVSSITHDSAVAEWETNEPATTAVSGGVSATMPGLRTSHRVELPGLTAQTTYTVTVSSSDAQGNGPTSRTVSFTTLPAPDTTPPVITKGPWSTDVTSTAATVQWETDEPANSGVSYNDGSAYVVLNDDALTTKHAVRLTGLRAGATYTITVSSKDAFGNGPTLSAPFTIQTPGVGDTTGPVFTSGPEVCNVNQQMIQVCFDTDEPAAVVVEYGTSAESMGDSVARAQLIRKHTMPVNGLEAQTTYYLRVRAKDAAGNETVSATFQATTAAPGSVATAPSFTQVPALTYVGSDRVVIEWETDRPCRSLVEYGTQSLSQQSADASYKRKHRAVISNLQPGTPYQFRVTITDVDGQSEAVDL